MNGFIMAFLFGGQMNMLSQIFRILVALFFGYVATNYAERQFTKYLFWFISFCYLYLAIAIEFINAMEYYTMGVGA